MLIIFLLLGLGMCSAHTDYGVSFRAENFDKTVRDINKEAIISHRREKRFVVGYYVPQNVTNKPAWGNMNTITNNITFTGPSNNRRNDEQIYSNNGNPGQPGYVQPFPKPRPYGNMINVTEKYVNPGQSNTNTIRPVNPNYIPVKPGYNSNSNNNNATWYIVPVNPATPGQTRYPGYPGYPAPNAIYPASNTGYPVPNTGYPASSTGYPVPNNGYPASSTSYPASNSWYAATTTGYPATNINPGQNYNTSETRPVHPNYNNINVIPPNKYNFTYNNPYGNNIQPVNPITPGNTPPKYPVPNTGFPASNTSNPAATTGYPVTNTWYPIPNKDPASNSVYPAPNTGYSAPNTGYSTPNTSYAAPNTGYSAPNTGYPAPNTGYPAPNTGYPASNTGYPASNTGYPAPNTGYPAPSGYFNNTASSADCKCKLPRANSTITKEERTMDACMIACNYCPDGMKMSRFGVCVKDLDYDEE